MFALALGETDDRGRLARRQRHGSDPLVDAALEQLAVAIEHPAADLADSPVLHQPRHFLGVEEAVEAERRIEDAKNSAMKDLNAVAADVAADIVQRLIGVAPAKPEIDKAVETVRKA